MTEKNPFKTLFVLVLTASAALGTASYASSHKGHGMSGDMGHMMKMMQHMHSQMHGERSHGGMKDGKRMMHGGMKKMLDANNDGNVTPDEAAEQLQAKLKEYDADGSGSLSIAEYEALHSAMVREKMVDRFQHLDADGDGQITSEEINAPADKMKRMQKRRAMMQSGEMPEQQNDPGMEQNSDDAQ